MSIKVITSTLCLTLLLSACSTPSDSSNSNNLQADAENQTIKLTSSLPPTFVMRGQVVIGHEVRSFTPCNSQQQFWIDMSQEQLQQTNSLVREPYLPLYAELIGYIKPSSSLGFSSDYTAKFKVTQINLLTAENPQRCSVSPANTKVVGVEPNWSIKFEGAGVQFSKMGSAIQNLKIDSKNISDSKRDYSFSNGSLTLNNEICSDGMSESLYGWTADFKLNNRLMKGCAVLSNMDATQSWQGSYQATSQKSQGFTVSLQLNDDHTAVTQYTYEDGSSTRTERGYWQQYSADKVQVVSTYHQGQRLIAERIFTRSNSTLTTEYETINGVKYPLIDGGLSLFRTN